MRLHLAVPVVALLASVSLAADAPKLAFVVVLEHAGDAAETAGPVANRLVRHMQQLGYFQSHGTVVGRPVEKLPLGHR